MKRFVLAFIILLSGCDALSPAPFDKCERDAIAQGKVYVFSVRQGHFVEQSEETAQLESERALDVQEAKQR